MKKAPELIDSMLHLRPRDGACLSPGMLPMSDPTSRYPVLTSTQTRTTGLHEFFMSARQSTRSTGAVTSFLADGVLAIDMDT